jgi:hypothetical protein
MQNARRHHVTWPNFFPAYAILTTPASGPPPTRHAVRPTPANDDFDAHYTFNDFAHLRLFAHHLQF